MTILFKEGCSTPVNLGEKGENKVTAIQFDYSAWIEEYGNGAISLLVKRKGDTAAYPVVLSTADGIATWTISDTDTAVQGYGKAEYVFTVDDKIAKSAVFSFFVAQDLGTAGDPPDPYESWIDTLTALGGETLQNAQAAQAAQSGAEAAQTAAETAATNAATSATNAAQSAGAARFAAESALASSDSASASATAASGHATAAETAKDLAISAAEDAQHSETQAELSASAAAEEAELAQTAAAQAQQSATNAATYVTQSANNAAQAIEAASDAEEADRLATAAAQSASASATSASQSASAASGSASAAATCESNAAQSATSAEASAQEAATEAAKLNNYLPTDTASGAIASFPDGADGVPIEALTVALEPIQNLNGQTSPYPAGGGVNKLPPMQDGTYTGNGVTAVVKDGVATLSGTTTASGNAFIIPLVETATIPNETCYLHCLNSVANGDVSPSLELSTDVSGTIIAPALNPVNRIYEVPTNRQGVNVDRIRFYIGNGVTLSGTFSPMVCLTNTATTYAPYSNLCPITGHTAAQVWRAGVNVWDEEWENGYLGIDGTNVSYIASSSRIRSKNWIPVVVGETYYYNGGGYGSFVIGAEDTNGTNAVLITSSESSGFTFTPTRPFIKFAPRAGYGGTYNSNISVNYPNTGHDYHAPSIVNISIPLGQTVYGGTVDVVQGVATVDRAKFTFSGSESWGLSGSSFFYTPLMASGVNVSDYYITENGVKLYLNGNNGQCRVYLSDNSFLSTSSDMHDYLTSTIGFVYKLATPIEIQLTAHELTTLLGTNNIWSDSGEVSVEYRADIQKYIAKVIAEALA